METKYQVHCQECDTSFNFSKDEIRDIPETDGMHKVKCPCCSNWIIFKNAIELRL